MAGGDVLLRTMLTLDSMDLAEPASGGPDVGHDAATRDAGASA